MNKWTQGLLLVAILLLAATLRLSGLDWDDYHHYHPDERYITWVATTIEWPSDWSTALKPRKSTFNPYYWAPDAASQGIEVLQDQPRKFAYGHFPLYLGVIATRLAERLAPLASLLPDQWLLTRDLLNQSGMVEFRHLTAVSRALTALVDVGTVALVFLLGRRVYGTVAGLLAAAFLALNVMHIQLARFFTSDPYLTFFVVAAVYFMVLGLGRSGAKFELDRVRAMQPANRSAIPLALAAMGVGLAVGSKFAAVLLLPPLALVTYASYREAWLRRLLVLGIVAFMAFFLTNPFAVLDLTCPVITPAIRLGPITIPALDWRSCFLENVLIQQAMVSGRSDQTFTRQYIGALPYLYHIEMQLRWGMGLLLGAIAFTGFAWAIWQELAAGYRRSTANGRPLSVRNYLSTFHFPPSTFLLLAWALPFFLTTGAFFVKFMRYLQPVTPFLMILGAAWLLSWRKTIWRRAVIILVLLATGLYALSYVNMFRQPHPWVVTSEWVFANVAPGSLILSEQWDDSLPSTLVFDGRLRQRAEYPNQELTWLTGADSRDDQAKLAANLTLLAQADYLTLTSNRVYGVVPRLPQRYPLSSQYHQLLFDGALGYEPVFVDGRFPNLFSLHLRSDTFGWPGLRPPPLVADYLAQIPGINGGRADESFLVYDQPLTIVFINRDRLTAAEMLQLFEVD